MPRTITVTGGFSGAAVADLRDSLGELLDATFLVALVPVGEDDPPPVGDPAWKSATATQTANSATVSVGVDDSTSVGCYNMAVDIVSNGRHEHTWAADRRGRRSLVVVT